MDQEDVNRLKEDHAIAYFRGEMARDSPESYTLEEKKKICEDMIASTNQVDAAMKKDFKALPPEAQSKMFEMLVNSGVETPEFWAKLLLDD